MDIRRLRYFLAVAEEMHFGRAAEKLHIVQPALSMQITALEKELGGLLFTRTSRRVELTEAGKVLRLEAQRIIELSEQAKITVQRSLKGETGCVRLGFAGNAVFTGKLMADLHAFHKAYPDAELVIREMPPHQQLESILAGSIDLGYAPDLNNKHDPAIGYEQIGSWSRVVAMSVDHPLKDKKVLTPAMLAQEPFIFYDQQGSDDKLHQSLRRVLGTEPQIAYRANTTLSVLALVAAGFGIALVPEPLTQLAIPGVVYKKFNEKALSANLMLLSRTEETNATVKAFLALVREAI